MTSPGYVVLVALHVLSAVIGFGALGATASFAHLARTARDPFSCERLQRFFRPGHNLAGRVIFLVPLFGVALLVAGHRHDAGAIFPWIGLGLWVLALGAASTALWPAERIIQALVVSGARERAPELRAACLRCTRAGALTSMCFLAAFVIMIAQPR